jgi:hypothetical protein
MLKAIALAGFFFAASALTPPIAASAPSTKASVAAPSAPAPHGICPYGMKC